MFHKKNLATFQKTVQVTNIEPQYYYTDYQKILTHLDEFKAMLQIIGTVNHAQFDFKVRQIAMYNPQVIRLIPLFSAIRPNQKIVLDQNATFIDKFAAPSITIDAALAFLARIGFYDIFRALEKINFVSYYLGIEVGLDSNARKNRSGKAMEKLVEKYLKGSKMAYISQAKITDLRRQNLFKNIEITTKLAKLKKFDFIIRTKNSIYFTEVNFFNTAGSKTAINTSFINLQEQVRNYQCNLNLHLKFLLITDGRGLLKTKSDLAGMLKQIEYVMNIDDLQHHAFQALP